MKQIRTKKKFIITINIGKLKNQKNSQTRYIYINYIKAFVNEATFVQLYM